MIRVQVTQDDLNKGRPNNCGACPVALALNHAWCEKAGPGYYWEVHTQTAHLWKDGSHCGEIRLPRSARNFIDNFDKFSHSPLIGFDLEDAMPIDNTADPDPRTYAFFYSID